jgi:hypothetical protein
MEPATFWLVVQCLNQLRYHVPRSKHVEFSNKRIMEEIVWQVGYLPELYEDAWSEWYKKVCDNFIIDRMFCWIG